jgi:N-acetylglucosaminyldiphosphoundecaprenol N-acetyl-beta-D-mannosaminyltransferase
MEFVAFLDVPIAATTSDGAVESVLAAAHGDATTFRLVNAGTFDAASSRPSYWELLQGEGVNLPDGKPLSSLLARTTGRDTALEQVRGPWLFERCLDRGRESGTRHFFLGATDATLAGLASAVRSQWPGTQVVGTYSPPFGDRSHEELDRQDQLIRESGADLVWVALGTPKQDAEALRILHSTGVTTAAVGAAFDFTAGTKRVAPAWMGRLHAEWLFRLLSEPRRLWRRYLVGNTRFVLLGVRHAIAARR